MTGSELRLHRKAAGLSQQALADRAGVTRYTVQYWEAKAVVDLRGWAPGRFLDALGLRDYSASKRARVEWGVTAIDREQARLDAKAEACLAAMLEKQAQIAAQARVKCGARTRKGTPCRSLSVPGRRRCRFHGGKSTGPRTSEGRTRIAEAQRKRWQAWRSAKTALAERTISER